MKKLLAVLTVLIIVGICIPAVSADEIRLDEELVEVIDTSGVGQRGEGQASYSDLYNYLSFRNIENHPDLSYITISCPYDFQPSMPTGEHSFTYTLNGETKNGVVYKSLQTNLLGDIVKSEFIVFFYDWDIGDLSGNHLVEMSWITEVEKARQSNGIDTSEIGLSNTNPNAWPRGPVYYSWASGIYWKHHLIVIERTSGVKGYEIWLNRTIEDKPYASTFTISKEGSPVFFNAVYGQNLHLWYPKTSLDLINITSPSRVYEYPFGSSGGTSPTNASVTVYVKNSQTGALLADAHILISASVNDNLQEVINKTLPSGIYNGELQTTGGGMPNPDYYRLIVTAEGYNSIMPYIDFEVGPGATIYAYLEPVGGAPENENNTFVDFYVRDLAANPISGATVNFGGYTLITNSAGYTIFEVEKDKTYSWTVSKSGYGSLTGNAVIGSDTRHTINTVIAPAVTPTTPTSIPTSTPISPTPTMTAPTGEPVSNWLEWFAAHFGMILGGGAEIGKIFMWLCFAVPVGVYVGKEAKAGAAGFMAGAGIVTLFFVLIGWVPIWLMVLLALIIGLLYAKVFNNSDNGGGR